MIADATDSQEKSIRAFLRDGVRSALDGGCATGEKTARIARQTDETVGIDAGHVRKAQARHSGRHLCFLTTRAEALCFTAPRSMPCFSTNPCISCRGHTSKWLCVKAIVC